MLGSLVRAKNGRSGGPAPSVYGPTLKSFAQNDQARPSNTVCEVFRLMGAPARDVRFFLGVGLSCGACLAGLPYLALGTPVYGSRPKALAQIDQARPSNTS